jgi:hypothetical protein
MTRTVKLLAMLSLLFAAPIAEAQDFSRYGSLSRQLTVRENVAYRQQVAEQARIRGLMREARRQARRTPPIRYTVSRNYAVTRPVVQVRTINTTRVRVIQQQQQPVLPFGSRRYR